MKGARNQIISVNLIRTSHNPPLKIVLKTTKFRTSSEFNVDGDRMDIAATKTEERDREIWIVNEIWIVKEIGVVGKTISISVMVKIAGVLILRPQVSVLVKK